MRESREITSVPSLHRVSTDALIWTTIVKIENLTHTWEVYM